jgi:hypothetical protein
LIVQLLKLAHSSRGRFACTAAGAELLSCLQIHQFDETCKLLTQAEEDLPIAPVMEPFSWLQIHPVAETCNLLTQAEEYLSTAPGAELCSCLQIH